MNAIVKVENLSFIYEEEPVLRQVSFEVASNEFVGLIGPNGGGKTTLLKLILGFLQPTEGSIKIFDQSHSCPHKKIAYVPQSLRFDRQFPISVMELTLSGRLSYLPWYGKYSKLDYLAAEEALDKVGMLAFRKASFGNLSGGQAQRVLIARALASQPSLLLLDEPTNSVDTKAQADIYAILRDLKGKLTIMMVTHDLKIAIDIIERVLCVQKNVVSLLPQEVCEHFALGLYALPSSK